MALPQLVLVPGLLNDAELWRDQIAGLAGIVRPVVADITRGSTLEALAAAVLAVGESRFALAGFSLGGIVAQEVMRLAPERVTHLALLGTTMLPDGPSRMAERRHLLSLAGHPGKFHGFGQRLVHAYLAPEHHGDSAMIARVRGMAERLGPEVFIRQSLIERPDSRATLAGIACPTMVLCGEHDAITPPSLHRDMAGLLRNASLVVVPASGHLVPIEQPGAVNAALGKLLRSRP